MQSLALFPENILKGIKYLWTDLDGTLTVNGKLSARVYQALELLRSRKINIFVVTGRPAGWCDALIRLFPIDGIVGENGAFVMTQDGHTQTTLTHPATAGESAKLKLMAIKDTILTAIPGSRVAKDQAYRLYDLAIDFAEEGSDLGIEVAKQIKDIFLSHGAHAKISSIHVNGWFGDYDKLSMVQWFSENYLQCNLQVNNHEHLFCGDSPNDEPMFAFFKNTVGMANVRPFAGCMTTLPGYVTERSEGEGFCELCDLWQTCK